MGFVNNLSSLFMLMEKQKKEDLKETFKNNAETFLMNCIIFTKRNIMKKKMG